MHPCDEQTARFMATSLLSHAREVYRYALAYCESSVANDCIAPERRAEFARSLDRMLKELYALMLMARYRGISRFANVEQIEAYADAARDVLQPAETSVDMQALLN